METFIQQEPKSQRYFKSFVGSEEFINNKARFCLWLVDASPLELRTMPKVLERVAKVKSLREQSIDKQARELAKFPTMFRDKNNPDTAVIVPLVSSENRKFIPLGFINSNTVPSNLCSFIPEATYFHLGVLSSTMHMSWVKYVCGRLKSDYRYSNGIVYNNFPWPENPNEKQVQAVEAAAQNVLDARAQFPNASLADLYDPNTMPPVLVKAHQALDKAVDLCYRPQPFINETKRIEFLFELYDKYTSGIFGDKKIKK